MKKSRLFLLLAGAILIAQPAVGTEVSLSGFGTIGYAKSDQPFVYQRFIKDGGSFMRDTVIGAQADVKFNPEWGMTVQAKVTPSTKSDNKWDTTIAWAFLSYRPSNDWLLRLGKMRVPAYLNSENLDVGVTYDLAHLPSEMYSISPTNDYVGASFAKTWNPNVGEVALDGYIGGFKTAWRFYQPDGIPTRVAQGSSFFPITVKGRGFVATLLRDDDKYRVGIHDVSAEADSGNPIPSSYSWVPGAALIPFPTPPGLIAGSVYAPSFVTKLNNRIVTFGAEISLPNDFKVIGEYGRRKVRDALTGIDSSGGYFALLKEIGAWTPYVSYAQLKSSSSALSMYQALSGTTVSGNPSFGPLAAFAAAGINASQRALAYGLNAYDQNTIALGTSYRLTATQKIKFEWAQTHVGIVSGFVDPLPGTNVSNKSIDVLSLSYSTAF